jgi:hypothetical protein
MLRLVLAKFLASILAIFLICDDFVGFGQKQICIVASLFVRQLIVAVCGPNSVSLDKSVLEQKAEVIGWLVDLTPPLGATLTPKYDAIDKMTYHFFSFDSNEPQPLILWQILHSFAERYSHGLRGMRPFVACFGHMIRKTGSGHQIATDASRLYVIKHQFAHKKEATSSTKFAIEMWRLVLTLLYHRKDWFSIPVVQYLARNGGNTQAIRYHSVSDASPYRICSAFYTSDTKELVGWTSVKLPYEADVNNKYQTNREYIGLLITLFLVSCALPAEIQNSSCHPITIKWINDNTGALTWFDKNKSSSLSSIITTMSVSAYQVLTNISLVGSEWIPGETMGIIDHESRREEHLVAGDYDPSELAPSLFVDLESNLSVMELISKCNPANPEHYKVQDYHEIFQSIYGFLQNITVYST